MTVLTSPPPSHFAPAPANSPLNKLFIAISFLRSVLLPCRVLLLVEVSSLYPVCTEYSLSLYSRPDAWSLFDALILMFHDFVFDFWRRENDAKIKNEINDLCFCFVDAYSIKPLGSGLDLECYTL